jgi:hypothetical protein
VFPSGVFALYSLCSHIIYSHNSHLRELCENFSWRTDEHPPSHDAERIRMLRSCALLLALLAMTVPTKGLRSSVSMVGRESVAVIGGGIAGLSFAKRLAASSKQFQVSVFDTGRLRPGGRCSSRFSGDAQKKDDPTSYQYLSQFVTDNAAQVLAVPETHEFQEFAAQVNEWEKQGVLKRFAPETVCDIQSTKSKTGFSLKPLARKCRRACFKLNLPSESMGKAVLEQRLQLWGAALPINTWETSGDDKNGVSAGGYIYDADHAVGVCGDWLVQPSVAGAWTSGQQLADHFVASADQNNA